ncbi:aminotransferase class I/II-fold pyridoxal phosphate-dependent enzyme [Tissierella sp. MSJ-40]|uniref:Aminotransferase class I/II-fold pyridoxal phosphate-dependent enzyme n=1 Tax=Tissierella simiarum TaxID=2841534 RepID=A0ABS6E5B5_9FIRM|nr:histidinol-phosphate transaminase [Tissierella simiarum]MBU5437439.1 aminotransferase class I/II-fold pyridoxal phosphate-dependent enzyme [Tissierella simiarum]
MEHGGDLISYKNEYEGKLIDYSSNINPLGPPEGLYEELIKEFNGLTSYPDIKYRELKDSVKDYLKCGVENVVLGNGAVEIIDNFTSLFNRIIVHMPSFLEYEKRGRINKKEIIKLDYNNDFMIDLNNLEKVISLGDLVILGNPNNPTGLRIEKDVLLNVYEIVKAKGGFLLLDEAFYEFSPRDYDSIQLFESYSYENVGIIRAATKFFALPGIRLGYGCTGESIVKEYERVQLPWSINSLAETAGKYIFKDLNYINKSKDYIHKEREYLLRELNLIKGIKPYDTHSNYILIELLNWEEEFIFKFFLKRGYVLRKCSSFEKLGENHIRIAIKDRENNERLLSIFKELEEI